MNANNVIPACKLTVPNTLIGWLKQVGIAALYVLFGYVIHHNFTSNGIVSVVWWGSGLALAALLIGGRRYLWGVILGVLVVNALANDTLVGALGTTLASILEVLLGFWLLTSNNKFSLSLNTLPDYLRLIALGGGVASLIGAIIGALALLFSGLISPAGYFGNALLWWMGDTLGVVLVTPLILAWWQLKSERLNYKQLLEELLLVGITFIAGQIIFLGWYSESFVVVPKGFMMFLFVTWVAIRLGIRPTIFILNMIAIQALSGAYLKVGYFADEIAISGLHNYWIYMMILSMVGMTISTYVNEIRQSEEALRKTDEKLRAYLDNISDIIWLIDLNLNMAFVSPNVTRYLGFLPEELIGRPSALVIHPEDMGIIINAQRYVMEHPGEPHSIQYRVSHKDGRWIYVESTGVNMLGNPEIDGVLVSMRNITERRQAETDLRIAATAFEAQEGMFVTDAHGVILRVNRAFTKITGYTAEEVIGKNPRLLQSGHHDADFYAAMWETINSTGAWEGEIWNRRKTGEVYPEHLTISAVIVADGMVTNYVATHTDITMNKAAMDEIQRLAFYDSLTGLPNRRLLWDRLESALASSHRSGRKGALLFIDMDNFKTLNDTLGHDMGDLLLQQVGQRLEHGLREGDTVARLGGDEFVVMLEDLSRQSLEAAAQTEVIGNKILATLNQPYQLATHDYHSSPSIGATLFNGHEQSTEELIKQADIAMYHVKSSGRNALHFFEPQMQASISARVALEAGLRLGLAENQFKLYYQAQVFQNRQIIGAEGLIRWQHPVRGLVLPANFIPLAEETGLILPIGQWVLEAACAQLKIWEGSVLTQHLQLAVNVSARQFRQINFVEQVSQVLSRNAINPGRLKLELTESLVLDDIDDSVHKMHALRKIGVRFSIDDFGTGYSSLSYLTQLPLDQLKIDQSFIHNIGIKTTDAVIVQTIIGMANNVGLEVIAEGVETEVQRIFLEQHDCQICQGYLFSKPLPIEQFESLQKQS
jgi:diguanylate cyclase (GGDEF)-like protein/PAS domain S-box-containing protein